MLARQIIALETKMKPMPPYTSKRNLTNIRGDISMSYSRILIAALGSSLLGIQLHAATLAGFRLHDDLYVCINQRCEQIDGDGGSGGAGEVFYTSKAISAAWNSSGSSALLCTAKYECRIRSENTTGSHWTSGWFSLHGLPNWENGPLGGTVDPDLTAAWNTGKYNYNNSLIVQKDVFWVWNGDHFTGPTRLDQHPSFQAAGVTEVYGAYNDGYTKYWDAVYLHIKPFPRSDIVIWNNQKETGAWWVDECNPACSLMGIGTDYMIGPTRVSFDQKVLYRRTDRKSLSIDARQVCYYNGQFKTMRQGLNFNFSYGDAIFTPYYYPSCGGVFPPTEAIHSMHFSDGTFSTYWDWM